MSSMSSRYAAANFDFTQMNIENNQANQLSIKPGIPKALPWRSLTSLNCFSWIRKQDT